jgi:Amt family ammonium transporter
MRKEKAKVGRFLVFITLWTTLVYDPVARWTWHPAGWSNQRGVMDFAGGTAVHITSGTTVAAFVIYWECENRGYKKTVIKFARNLKEVTYGVVRDIISGVKKEAQKGKTGASGHKLSTIRPNLATGGPSTPPGMSTPISTLEDSQETDGQADRARPVHRRHTSESDLEAQRNDSRSRDDAPHNVNNIVLGTALIWIGWFGFNGGSALGGNLRAVSACTSTHVAACGGGLMSLLIGWVMNYFYPRYHGDGGDKVRPSVVYFSDGAIIALVAITPAAGYVRSDSSDTISLGSPNLTDCRFPFGALGYLGFLQQS